MAICRHSNLCNSGFNTSPATGEMVAERKRMRKHTFTIFTYDDKVHSYLFDVTRAEAQKIVSEMNNGEKKYYYMEGYIE